MNADQHCRGDGWEFGLPAHGVECLSAVFVCSSLGDLIGRLEQTELSELDIALNSPAVTDHMIRPVLHATQSWASHFLSLQNSSRCFYDLAEHRDQQEYCIADAIEHCGQPSGR